MRITCFVYLDFGIKNDIDSSTAYLEHGIDHKLLAEYY